ncbi:helix-turn-helix domain-containing protein [Actinomadura macrotermitis]|uniref:Cytoskeleton protein RodZ n=1 Tax=Actinomadura macrotermitis TaxID=2585200 RepID=A0A7K0BNS0_9ACTN|nr:Cytoskeleton protein RodZ [Actinomadura macrotermitis]
MSIGETLADERHRAGLTITQVSLRTRIRETVIRGIEHDDFTACGGDFYARGHIRSIARVVGVDPEPLVRAYDDAHGGAPQPLSAARAFEPERPVVFHERRTANWSAAMGLALVMLVAIGVVQLVAGDRGEHHTAQQVAVAPPASPSARPSAAPTSPAPRKEVTLQVKARRGTWVNVRGDKGKQLFTGVIDKGGSKDWTAKKKITIVIGSGGGLRLTVNGKDLGTPGHRGESLRLAFTPRGPEEA